MGRIASVVIFLSIFLHASNTFDLSVDFSLTENPSKGWQYGYSETSSLDPGQFRLDKLEDTTGGIGFWHPSGNDSTKPGYYPYVAFNPAKESQLGSQKGWSARAGEIAMEASNTGQFSIVRFIAPIAGTYRVSAQFEGVHFGLSTTDVHVLHNSKSLFDAIIDGYGGDPALHTVQGASPNAKYDGKIEMKANDIVTFAVGYGQNKTHFSDTTGLFAKVELLSNAGS